MTREVNKLEHSVAEKAGEDKRKSGCSRWEARNCCKTGSAPKNPVILGSSRALESAFSLAFSSKADGNS